MDSYNGVYVLDECSIVVLLKNASRALISGSYSDAYIRIQSLYKALTTEEIMFDISKNDYTMMYNNITKSLLALSFHRPDEAHPLIRDLIYHFLDKTIPKTSGMVLWSKVDDVVPSPSAASLVF